MSFLIGVRGDIDAALERDPAAKSSWEVALFYPGFHARLFHRFAHVLDRAGVPLIPRGIMHVARSLTGIEIHPGASIGPRFFIDHGMGVVIGETTEIGENVVLYQGVTLGGTSTRRVKRHPTLEDGVVVGARAKVIGAVVIGEGAQIGAGSVVVTNVPPNATVVGIPGHIVSFHDDSNGVLQRLPDPEWERINELDQRVQELCEMVEHVEDHMDSLHEEQHNGRLVSAGPGDDGSSD
ncbi:MAG TPA: serine O-acetyltransferase [Dehalococcoidia bacterium]|nr:serine O-acetyltransferase [Dehalococcoidia bacterium]